MSRIKGNQLRSIALEYFRAFSAHTFARVERDQFTRHGIYTFTCDGEEFIAIDGYHIMDGALDRMWEEHPQATADRIYAVARAIIDECFTKEVHAAQRAMMDILDREMWAHEKTVQRVMNPRIVFSRDCVGRVIREGRIMRIARGWNTLYQFVLHEYTCIIDVIENESLWELRQQVATRLEWQKGL